MTTNQTIIVGRLAALNRDGAPRAYGYTRNQIGGAERSISLNLTTAFGRPASLLLHFAATIAGAELLPTFRIDQPIVVVGELQRMSRYDARFASDSDDPGLYVVETHIRVGELRAPRADEPLDTTAIWLCGEVVSGPKVVRSQANPAVQLASLVLRVTMRRPSAYPGSRAQINETTDINVAVPLGTAGAEALYRVGNQVSLEGQLDCALVTIHGEQVDQRLAQLDAELLAEHPGISPAERQRAEAARRRARAALRQQRKLSVVASYIELLSGTPVDLREATRLQHARRHGSHQILS